MSSHRPERFLLFFIPAVFFLFISCSSSSAVISYSGTTYELKPISRKKLPEHTQGWYFDRELQSAITQSAAVPELSLMLDFTQYGMESVTLAFVYSSDTVGAGSSITSIAENYGTDRTPVKMGIGMAFDSTLPVGFIIQYKPASSSSIQNPDLQLKTAEIRPLSVGWSRYPGVTFAFPKEGGTARYTTRCPSTFDFSAVQNVTGSVTIGFERQPILKKQNTVEFSVGTEKLTVRQSPAQQKVHLYPESFRNKASRISVVSNQDLVSSLLFVAGDLSPADPIPADPALILSWPQKEWKNPAYQLYRWEQFPDVLIFDFADYAIQDDMLKRLAFYTEKAGFKGRLAPDAEIRDLHGYNAHDYRSESLASFFSTAAREQFPLNEYERQLEKILVTQGIIIPDTPAADSRSPVQYRPGTGAIVSISRESAGSLRWQLLTHECYHGLFFVDEQFRSHVATVYDTMDQRTLAFLLMYFRTQKSLGYDTEDRYLMHTELMSYLLQQGKNATIDYYVRRADYKSMFTEDLDLCTYIKDTNAQGFVDAHQRLEEYVFTRYGLQGGRVNLIER
ncbi:MAG: hypothetical protein MJ178_01175 [Treponemataceae bacterium]|nr:hypothetical protein [Treponemataceae bacterium]